MNLYLRKHSNIPLSKTGALSFVLTTVIITGKDVFTNVLLICGLSSLA